MRKGVFCTARKGLAFAPPILSFRCLPEKKEPAAPGAHGGQTETAKRAARTFFARQGSRDGGILCVFPVTDHEAWRKKGRREWVVFGCSPCRKEKGARVSDTFLRLAVRGVTSPPARAAARTADVGFLRKTALDRRRGGARPARGHGFSLRDPGGASPSPTMLDGVLVRIAGPGRGEPSPARSDRPGGGASFPPVTAGRRGYARPRTGGCRAGSRRPGRPSAPRAAPAPRSARRGPPGSRRHCARWRAGGR